MKKKIWIYIFGALAIASCKKKQATSVYFLSPEEGANLTAGKSITLKLDAKEGTFDSIQYFIDTTFILSKKDTSSSVFSTEGLKLGTRILTAKIFKGADSKEITSNIVLLPGLKPVKYSYSLVNTFSHDTSSYTQGLEFHDGIFYESDGGMAELGGSSIRKVAPDGKVLKQVDISTDIFAEGLTVIGDKVLQLTWQNGYGIVYNKSNLEKIKEFPYQESREGWGLAFDGARILKSDGTNRIYFLNKDSYREEGYMEVFDHNGPVSQLNELEVVDGRIFANVYQSDKIVIINPATGIVEAELDLTDLYPENTRNDNADVLNGIAWDTKGKRLFVTGKKWDKLFEIKINR